MANFKNLNLQVDEGILTIQIDRQDKHNALSTVILDELRAAVNEGYDDPAVKGMIITGAGEKAFVAGADIKELTVLNELNGRKFAENGQEVFALIDNCHKPIIAVVNGYALGGGCELALACHLRIATENAQFGQPEVGLGIIPGYGGTQRLTQIVGKSQALEIMMTGKMLSASHAKELGMVNYVLPDKASAIEKAKEVLGEIFKNAPLAVGLVITCVNAVYSEQENGYQTEANSFANCCKSNDFKEGVAAFMEKRIPDFRGE